MEFIKVTENKKDYMDLLFLADEEEDMIDRYLEDGEMYVEKAGGKVVGEAVITDLGMTEDGRTIEIKNIATDPEVHGKGLRKGAH